MFVRCNFSYIHSEMWFLGGHPGPEAAPMHALGLLFWLFWASQM